MTWPPQLDRFPIFTIDRVIAGEQSFRCEGRLTNATGMPQVGRYIMLPLELPECIYGDVVATNIATGQISLDVQEESRLTAGASFPLLDGYHGGYTIWMVLDEARAWNRQRFASSDAIATPSTDGYTRIEPMRRSGQVRFYPPTEGEELPSVEGDIVADAWDHEHCTICDAHIDEDHPEGYIDSESNWVCLKCFTDYVSRHDLGFVSLP